MLRDQEDSTRTLAGVGASAEGVGTLVGSSKAGAEAEAPRQKTQTVGGPTLLPQMKVREEEA